MDDTRFENVVRSIATGSSVDWDALETRPADASAREVLRELRVISQIAGVFDAVNGALPAPPALEPGQSWGSFTVIDQVGRGAFADVYRAHDTRLDREVALKLLRPGTSDLAGGAIVIEEGRLLARVHHPCIVTVFGADRIDDRVGIWMELVRGRTLEQILREQGPLGAQEAASVGVEICRALTALHRAGLVHRDVKAANVMREDGGRIVLMDFGAGRLATETGQGSLAGTPLYCAPELLEGSAATIRSDVYSVGILLYHLVSNTYPVRGTTLGEVREAHRQRQRASLREVRPDLPRRFVDVIDRASASAPEARFESASALESALTLVLASTPTSGRRSRRLAVFAAISMMVAGLALSAWVNWNGTGTAGTRLGFQPRDLVLITRFDNRTGESTFDGAIEYALQRELSGSDVVGVVPRERIEDALRLMKRATDTAIDRAIGREVSLRDGHIKALLAGRVEKFGSAYVITTELIDPANDAVVATIGDEANGQDAVLTALRRQASRVRVALGENRDRMTGADPNIEPGATESLLASQLYNQAYQLGRRGQWSAARELSRRMVAIDPNFASGWVWLAWSVKNSEFAGTVQSDDPRISLYREFLERAFHLAARVPDWERHWIVGSYYTLLGDHARAVPQYEALLRLRPDHYYAYNNLLNARLLLSRPEDAQALPELLGSMADQRVNDSQSNAFAAVAALSHREVLSKGEQYIDRLRALADSDGDNASNARVDLDFVLAYRQWHSGNLPGLVEQLERIAKNYERYPVIRRWEVVSGLTNYYVSLGRVRDASRFLASLSEPSERTIPQLWVAINSGNWTAVRRQLYPDKTRTGAFLSPVVYAKAGRLDIAQRAIDSPNIPEPLKAIGRGLLLLLEGRAASSIPHLERGIALTRTGVWGDYWWACEALADALHQVGRKTDAIVMLESCSTNTFKLVLPIGPAGHSKMSLDLHLADLYRERDRVAEAQTIEHRVRERLALADPDYPLILRLKNR